MGPVSIQSWYPKFNGSHFGSPPSSIHRMTRLGGNPMWTMTYRPSPQARSYPDTVICFVKALPSYTVCTHTTLYSTSQVLVITLYVHIQHSTQLVSPRDYTVCTHTTLYSTSQVLVITLYVHIQHSTQLVKSSWLPCTYCIEEKLMPEQWRSVE